MDDTTPTLHGIIVDAESDIGGQLVAVQGRPTLEIFTDPTVVPALLAAVRTVATTDYTPDTTTDKGRKAIAARAYRVAQSKAYLDTLGKEEVARLKELPRLVDAARKALRDGLDEIRDEIRRPLTEWEARTEALKSRLAHIQNAPARVFHSPSGAIRAEMDFLRAELQNVAEFAEFADEAITAINVTEATLRQQWEDRLKWERDQAELERLRQEKAERDRKDREEQLRKEGEERARASMAQTTPVIMSAEVVTAPTMIEQAIPMPAPAPVQPDADLEHRRTINRQAMAAILPHVGGDEASAKSLMLAIVQGRIPHVTITY